jgi:hypothetical protein
VGVRAGRAYVDVGTLHGYREAIDVLKQTADAESGVRIVPRALARGAPGGRTAAGLPAPPSPT